jgi:peptidoglycan/xylan/chitin deacetylase (PgdA/CDA1 family)
MMKRFALIILSLILFATFLIARGDERKQVAITLDDLPASNIATFTEQLRINKKILDILDQYQVKATGFVIAQRLFGKMDILNLWLKEGHDLGNHTYTHMDFDKVDPPAFKMEIVKGVSKIRKLLRQYKKDLRYFRFPYLHEGNTIEKKKSIQNFLEENGYTIAPVTINPRDQEYNGPFVKAWGFNDKKLQDSVKVSYLQQVKKKTRESEDLSRQLFGREIKHVLVLHLNRINAEVLDQILKYYSRSGYSFIPLEDALKDSVYSLKEEYVGSEELTWLERIKHRSGKQ